MVKEAEFEDETERLFIDVCQESWRRRMGKIGDRAGREGADPQKLVQKEAEKLRVSLSRSRNAHTLRETVVDLWSRAGKNKKLNRDNLRELWPFFAERNWRKARDLALLALISYQPETPEEKALLAIDETEEKEDAKTDE